MAIENLINSRVVLALTGYCIFAGILVIWKPSFIYDRDRKNFRKFGVGSSETLFSLEILLVLAAIFAYASASLFSSGSLYSVFDGFFKNKTSISEGNGESLMASSTLAPVTVPVPVPGTVPTLGPVGYQMQQGGGDFYPSSVYYPQNTASSFFHQPTQPFFHQPSISFPPSKIWKSSGMLWK